MSDMIDLSRTVAYTLRACAQPQRFFTKVLPISRLAPVINKTLFCKSLCRPNSRNETVGDFLAINAPA